MVRRCLLHHVPTAAKTLPLACCAPVPLPCVSNATAAEPARFPAPTQGAKALYDVIPGGLTSRIKTERKKPLVRPQHIYGPPSALMPLY